MVFVTVKQSDWVMCLDWIIWFEVASVSLVNYVCINIDVFITAIYSYSSTSIWGADGSSARKWKGQSNRPVCRIRFIDLIAHWSPVFCHWCSLHLSRKNTQVWHKTITIRNYKISLRLLVWVYSICICAQNYSLVTVIKED